MKEKLLNRLEHCLKELENKKCSLEEEYKKIGPGTMAFDVTLKIERIIGEINMCKETISYIKYDL